MPEQFRDVIDLAQHLLAQPEWTEDFPFAIMQDTPENDPAAVPVPLDPSVWRAYDTCQTECAARRARGEDVVVIDINAVPVYPYNGYAVG